MDEEILKLLTNLTNKENIKLVSRGNKAILYALRIAKKLGKNKVFIQDQGGWITYKQFILKLKMDLFSILTDYGLISEDMLNHIDGKSVLLVNSMPGYFAEQEMDTIYSICAAKKCLVINDITGTIGSGNGKVGDILLASFGEDKPVNLGKGGLIAVSNKSLFELTEIIEEEIGPELMEKLIDLPDRVFLLKKLSKKIKEELKRFEIIHSQSDGINVIAKFKNEKEKKELIDYCLKNDYEYTECPRYIRVLCDAISIEVKRL